MVLSLGFFYVVVYCFFCCFHLVGLTMGILVRLGLRYRLLWFWVLLVGLSYGSFGGFRVEV